ncbi:MAG: hypothetical protein AAF495_03550 [Pseudomonadota bacterium]
MSGVPTLEDDKLDLAAAKAAGWSSEDLEWEIKQERAAAHLRAQDLTQAGNFWQDGLELARAHFAENDPRLGTSLANAAYGLRAAGNNSLADSRFAESLRVWSGYGLWIQAMPLDQRARSSLFHLRMELKHRDQYEKTARERLRRFGEESHKAIVELAAGGPPLLRGLERWRAEKPATFSERRKFLSACLLLVSRPE